MNKERILSPEGWMDGWMDGCRKMSEMV